MKLRKAQKHYCHPVSQSWKMERLANLSELLLPPFIPQSLQALQLDNVQITATSINPVCRSSSKSSPTLQCRPTHIARVLLRQGVTLDHSSLIPSHVTESESEWFQRNLPKMWVEGLYTCCCHHWQTAGIKLSLRTTSRRRTREEYEEKEEEGQEEEEEKEKEEAVVVGPPGLMAGVHALIVDMNRLQQRGAESCFQDNNCLKSTILPRNRH